ncbi:MAG: hypothetical protein NTV07_03660, partial [Candidatus Omnitrophica bacterium]|nr:hypothetical protein [Candidatus Omnitrophota bacterium]
VDKAAYLGTALGGMACRHIGGSIEFENIVDAVAFKRRLITQMEADLAAKVYPNPMELQRFINPVYAQEALLSGV